MHPQIGLLIVGLSGVLCPNCFAQDDPVPRDDPQSVSSERIAELVDQLDSDDFATRTAAVKRLGEAGLVAIPALVKAATSQSIEQRFRAMKVLTQLHGSDDEAIRAATISALKSLRESKIRDTARVAQQLLDKPTYEIPPGVWHGTGRIGRFEGGLVIRGAKGVRITAGRVQIGVDSQIVVTKVVDGLRMVDIYHGTGLGMLILDGPKRSGIEIHLRKLNDEGEPVFQRVQVKSSAELAKKHPAVSAMYNQYKGFQRTRTTIQGLVQ